VNEALWPVLQAEVALAGLQTSLLRREVGKVEEVGRVVGAQMERWRVMRERRRRGIGMGSSGSGEERGGGWLWTWVSKRVCDVPSSSSSSSTASPSGAAESSPQPTEPEEEEEPPEEEDPWGDDWDFSSSSAHPKSTPPLSAADLRFRPPGNNTPHLTPTIWAANTTLRILFLSENTWSPTPARDRRLPHTVLPSAALVAALRALLPPLKELHAALA
jgi:hypothetical protein